jgi:hypothetical protein
MLEHQWPRLVEQHDGDGLLWLDAEGYIKQTNLKGQEYLTLLAEASVGDALTHLGEHSLRELVTLPATPQVEMCHEVVLVGPPCQVFEVVIQPVLTGAQFEGWILYIREVPKERQEQKFLEPQGRPTLVVHWPPVSPATSNLA